VSLLNALDLGRKALAAASAGIDVTSNNVGNSTTVGYSRQSVATQASDPLRKGAVWFGQGVDVTGVVRSTDRLLGMRLVEAAGTESHARARLDSLRLAETWFDETGATGLAEAWDELFDAFSSLTADPSDASLRRGALDAGSALARTVSRTAVGLSRTIDDLDAGLESRVDEVNALLTEVAALNESIGRGGVSGGPADLLDRRDQLVRELGESVGATVEFAADGQATVFLGGHAVVSGGAARELSLSEDDAGDPVVSVSMGNGAVPLGADLGGTLGGTLDARATTSGWLDQLDQFAYDLATQLNAQHAAGFDATGAAGGDFFAPPSAVAGAAAALALDATLAADPDLLALGGSATGGVGDDTNLLALIDFRDGAYFDGATRSGLDLVSNLVSEVGSAVASAEADADDRAAALDDLDAMRTAISGVDPDEEALKLIEFQSAYKAASQVITAASELLQSLLAIG